MSAQHPAANRRTDREQHASQSLDAGHVSTRVLIDSGTPPTCDACGDTIELKSRHKCLSLQDGTEFRELTFCDDECLARDREQRSDTGC